MEPQSDVLGASGVDDAANVSVIDATATMIPLDQAPLGEGNVPSPAIRVLGKAVSDKERNTDVARGPEPEPMIVPPGVEFDSQEDGEGPWTRVTTDGYAGEGGGDDDDDDPYSDIGNGLKLSQSIATGKMEDQDAWVIQPDWFKFWISLAMFSVVLVTFVILSVAFVGGGLFCPSGLNIASTTRVGMMYSFQNTSAPVCTHFYDYACGSYNKRFTDSSLFQETQNEIFSIIVGGDAFNTSIDRTLPDVPNYNTDLGIFECLNVDIAPDYRQRNEYAVYISPYCYGCPPQVHHTAPSLITGTILAFPGPVQDIISQAGALSRASYWITPESGATPQAWMEHECNRTETSVEAQWEHISNQSTATLLTSLYERDLDTCCENALLNTNVGDLWMLVEEVRRDVVSYIGAATWLVSDASRDMLITRVQQLPILFGGAVTRDSGCTLSQSLYDCIKTCHTNDMNALLGSVDLNSSMAWPFSRFVVNAAYTPQADAVYIPWGVAQPPYYDPMWEDDITLLKTSTLGFIIAHEIGHALDNTPWTRIDYTDEDNAAIREVKDCIAMRYALSGSVRTARTESENWADYIGMQVVLRKIRKYPVDKVKTAFVLWAQTWCSAGSPQVNALDSTDPHSTPFLRANATLSALAPWHSAFECTHVRLTDGPLCG